jgi:TonB family protein
VRVGEDLDALRFAPYNHPSKDLQGKTSSSDARGSRPPGVAAPGRPASSTVAAREQAPYLAAERGEGSNLARPGSARGQARPEPEQDRLSRIPKDGEVALPKGFRVMGSTKADHDRRQASSQRSPDRIDAARPSGHGQATGRGRGALAGRRGSPEGAEHGAPLWLAGGDRRYLDYFRGIYRKVQPLWVFPKQLEVVYEQGEVIVQFAILGDGTVRDVRVHKSSGYRQFDANVIAAIEKAAPFGPIPRGLGRRLEILAPFEFANPMVR